ncbi:MAG: hypothetical protein R3D45_16185 [Rhizobiaceae bacterium]
MVRKLIMTAAAALLLSAPAWAGHCPKDAAAIDAYLAKADVSGTLKASVTALKDEGMMLHQAGNHAESEAKLAEAMRMLLNGE